MFIMRTKCSMLMMNKHNFKIVTSSLSDQYIHYHQSFHNNYRKSISIKKPKQDINQINMYH